MKKRIIVPLTLILLASISLSAQTKIAVTAGADFANVRVKALGISASPKMRTGIIAGIFIDVPLSTNFSFQPALNFVQKGYSGKDETGTDKVGFNYLEIPVNFIYTAKKSEGFFIGAGPSIAYGISGKEKFKYAGNGMPDQITKIKYGSGNDEIKAFDFGANAVAGYKFGNGFIISGNYNLGLSNIGNTGNDPSDETATIKNRYFSVKIGYEFGGNKHK